MTVVNPNQARVSEAVKSTAVKKVAASEEPSLFDRQAKLLQHMDRIVEWREKGTTIPVTVTIDPTFKCNHRCPGCHGLMGQDLSTIPLADFERIASQLGAAGVRSAPLGGGGDPSCHPHFGDVLRCLHDHGLETGYFTNGELLKDDALEATIEACRWVRFSLDADGPEIHQLVHAASPKAFDKVVNNMRLMHDLRVERKADLVLGAGYLVRPDTMKGMYGASELCRDLGMDYIRIRPFFGYDNKPLCNSEQAEKIIEELSRCKELESDSFKVNAPTERMAWVASGDSTPKYTRCNIHHFTTYIGGDMKMYLCCHTVGWEKYCLGDLSKQSFTEIWKSDRRKEIYENIDYRDCATPCSMTTFNELLHKFDANTIHSNFL